MRIGIMIGGRSRSEGCRRRSRPERVNPDFLRVNPRRKLRGGVGWGVSVGILFIFSRFSKYIYLEYICIQVINRVTPAEYVVHMRVVAPHAYVHTYSTRRDNIPAHAESLVSWAVQRTHLPTYLPTHLPTYLSTCVPTKLSTNIPTHLSTYLPVYLPAYLPT